MLSNGKNLSLMSCWATGIISVLCHAEQREASQSYVMLSNGNNLNIMSFWATGSISVLCHSEQREASQYYVILSNGKHLSIMSRIEMLHCVQHDRSIYQDLRAVDSVGRSTKTDGSSGAINQPIWVPCLRQCKIFLVTLVWLWSGEMISIVQSGAIANTVDLRFEIWDCSHGDAPGAGDQIAWLSLDAKVWFGNLLGNYRSNTLASCC